MLSGFPAYFAERYRRELTLPDSLPARFARGAFWAFAANVSLAVLHIVSVILVARLLGRWGLGELGIITSTVQTMGVFAGLGLGLTATKHVAEWRDRQSQRAGRIIALTTGTGAVAAAIGSLFLLAGAPSLAPVVFHAPHLTGQLQLASGLLLFSALMGLQNATLCGLESFKTLAKVNLFRGLLNSCATLAGAWLLSVTGAIAGSLAGAAAGWLISQREVKRECTRAGIRITYEGAWAEHTTLWNFSLPAFLSSVVLMLGVWLGNALLVRTPQGLAQMGIFSAADQWRLALLFIPMVINQALVPILSRLYGAEDSERCRKLLRSSLLLVVTMTLALALAVGLLSYSLMSAYGSDFRPSRSVLLLLVLSAALANPAAVVGAALSSMGRVWGAFALNGVWVFILLSAASLLVAKGAWGLALAYVISYGFHFLATLAYGWRCQRVLSPSRTRRAHRTPSVTPRGEVLWS